jgi:NAD(P)-dependent dehydrogenase (short-subunit alcohol dehydrogenase family)
MQYRDLAGKVAILTGAAGNLGAAVARNLAAQGMNLALLDLKQEAFERAFGPDLNPDWLISLTDISDSAAIAQMMDAVLARFGQVNALVNIAGGYAGGQSVIETPAETWDKMMNLNAKTAFLMSQAVAKTLVEKGQGGRIINIGAKPGLQGTANFAAYAASKSAVLRLTESMAAELRPHRITVNTLLPSMLDTPANRAAMPDADFNKWVAPDSLAGVISFLLSEAGRDISGASIPVYGGVG